MHEEQIIQVAKILDEWNPLGEVANTIEQLDGYRYEAIDILSAISIFHDSNIVKNSIENVLTQAFDIELNEAELIEAAKKVEKLLCVK